MEGIIKYSVPSKVVGIQITTFSDRYCILAGSQLHVYEKKPAAGAHAPCVVDLHKASIVDAGGKKFQISGEMLVKAHLFEAVSADSKKQWMSALQAAGKASVSIGDFELLRVVGEGAYGVVYKIKHKGTNDIYAMKVIDKDKLVSDADVQGMKSEAMFLQKMYHPFIVHMHCCFQTNDKLYLIMDYLAGGEAFYLMQKKVFKEDDVRLYAMQLGLAIDYLHHNNVIYRDLKPENCLLDTDGNMVLTDFGLSKRLVASAKRCSKVGTPAYWAPEMYNPGFTCTKAVDYWALGCLIFEMITSLHPFRDDRGNPNEYQTCCCDPNLNSPLVSDKCRGLLSRLLEKDVDKRLQTFPEFKSDPWFEGLDPDCVYRREVKPTYAPNPDDAQNFAPEFVNQKPALRPSVAKPELNGFEWEHPQSPFFNSLRKPATFEAEAEQFVNTAEQPRTQAS